MTSIFVRCLAEPQIFFPVQVCLIQRVIAVAQLRTITATKISPQTKKVCRSTRRQKSIAIIPILPIRTWSGSCFENRI